MNREEAIQKMTAKAEQLSTAELYFVEALAQIAEANGRTFSEAMRAFANGDAELQQFAIEHTAQLMRDVEAA